MIILIFSFFLIFSWRRRKSMVIVQRMLENMWRGRTRTNTELHKPFTSSRW